MFYVNFQAYDKFIRPAPSDFWGSEKSRGPAYSRAKYVEITGLNPLEDYFQSDKHSGYITHKMDIQFWSDKGLSYFKEKGRKSIQDGLKKTFKELAGKEDQSVLTLAGKFITREILNNFVYNLKFYKLFDANFAIDFMFTPKNVANSNFDDLLDTNKLVNLDSKGKLLRELNEGKITFLENILKTNVPSSGHIYQYIGGAISITPELLDTSWKITNPIPNPSKNLLKGKVTLRKYYRVNRPELYDISTFMSKSDKNLKIKLSEFRDTSIHKQSYLTVDTIYNFNIKNLRPKKEKIVIHFGKLISLDRKESGIIKRIFQFFKKSNNIKTSEFILEGVARTKKNMKVRFKTKILKLTFDVEKQEFKGLKLRTSSTDAPDIREIERDIKKVLLDTNLNDFIKALQLNLLVTGEKI